jgi:hypothetical protein
MLVTPVAIYRRRMRPATRAFVVLVMDASGDTPQALQPSYSDSESAPSVTPI